MAVPWERVTGSFSMDFFFTVVLKLYLKMEPKEPRHSKQLNWVNPWVYSVPVPAMCWYQPWHFQSIGQLCYNTKLRGWELHMPTLFVHYNVQASAVSSRIYLIITLVLCIFIRVCSEEKQQLFSQLKSKWPHHLFKKRKIVLGLK